MAEQIGLYDAAGTTATDATPTKNDAESFVATGAPGTPFIHGRDYFVDFQTYRHAGTADLSKVMLTYHLYGEPVKQSNALPTGDLTNGSTSITNISPSVPTGVACKPGASCVGMRISGTGIPPDTFIAATNGSTTITMTRAATATNATVSLAINSRFVGKVREWKFIRQMLGFPYKDQGATGQLVLRRNLPEPIRWASGQWKFDDGRRFLAITANTNSSTALTNVKKIVNGVSVDGALVTPDLTQVGTTIYGPGLAAGTTIAARVSDTALTLSAAATATTANQQFLVFFPPTATNRYTHWCTAFGNVRGVAPKAQKQESTPTMYPASAQGTPPEPQFEYLMIDFTFEQLPYECRLIDDVAASSQEWSRFVIYPEEASARLLQIRGGAFWDTATGGFGQPYRTLNGDTHSGTAVIDNISSTANLGPGMTVTGVGIGAGAVIVSVDSATQVTLSTASTASATVAITFSGLVLSTVPFAGKEGLPKTIGENAFTWKWMDVPIWAYDWNYIQTHFGQINSVDFGSTYTAPFYVIPKECCLLETCQRVQKNNVMGEPIWDLIFYMRSCPLDDRKGYWNRLYNNLGFVQRYKVGNQDFFKSFDFANLFRPYGYTS